MPRGIKYIVTLNILLAAIFIANLLLVQNVPVASPMLVFINLVGAAVLIVVTLILLLRLVRFVAFGRLLIYILALILGLQILLTLKYLFSVYGMFVVALDVVVIIYLIGVRGYLASARAATYFVNPPSSE